MDYVMRPVIIPPYPLPTNKCVCAWHIAYYLHTDEKVRIFQCDDYLRFPFKIHDQLLRVFSIPP
jgi:hypothetical protein